MTAETKGIYDPARTEPYAPAEMCEIARAAAHATAKSMFADLRQWGCLHVEGLDYRYHADAAYPAPYVERVRVVMLPVDAESGVRFRFRVFNGVVEWASSHAENWSPFWREYRSEPTATLLAGLADLLTTPTERVSAEVGQ